MNRNIKLNRSLGSNVMMAQAEKVKCRIDYLRMRVQMKKKVSDE